jgi:hypothetical protein
MRENSVLLTIFVFLIIVVIPLNSQPIKKEDQKASVIPKEKPAENSEKESKSKGDDALIPIFSSSINNTIPGKANKKHIKEETGGDQSKHNGWVDVLNNPSDIFTFALAIFTFGLFLITRKQLGVARDMAEIEMRAYVAIDKIEIKDVKETFAPTVTFDIKNFGKTPAHDSTFISTIAIRHFPLGEDTLPDIPLPHKSVAIIPSGGVTNSQHIFGLKLDRAILNDLGSNKTAIYVYGKISYKDVFRKNHTTRFRCFYNGLAGKLGETSDLNICDEGNEAD